MTNAWKAIREHRMALVVDEAGATVAIIAEGDSYEAEDEVARLLAAAPDLLAALQGMLLGSESDAALAAVVGEDVLRDARAAIAAATSSASP